MSDAARIHPARSLPAGSPPAHDKRSDQVRYAVLDLGGFLGMHTARYPLPWNMLKYDKAMEGYVVPLDKTKLEGAPRYQDDDIPAYTTDYGRKVNGYYGIGL